MLGELKQLSDNREIDLLVKILKIFEKDEYNLELRIKDTSNEMWFIVIPKLKYGTLKEGEIVPKLKRGHDLDRRQYFSTA